VGPVDRLDEAIDGEAAHPDGVDLDAVGGADERGDGVAPIVQAHGGLSFVGALVATIDESQPRSH
jgi:hypothetical protein